MNLPAEKQDWRLMRRMFSAIAPRYDFITRALSFGMDRRWKRLGVEKAALPPGAAVLDLACGTGDFSQLVLRAVPNARVVAVDLTEEMLRTCRRRGLAEVVCGDAGALPFVEGVFECVFVGYGLRNFPDLNGALKEIHRVTRPGGRLVSLDFFLPTSRFLRRLYLGGLFVQGAFWGLLLHGRPSLYTYIPRSLRSFLSLEELSARLQRKGYAQVDARAYIFGGIGLHWAVKK
jgi:demethylmenaquinone methyltransferase/2-methoxy-6-polyprenyl-1,4-benzoquinol methylase